MMALNLLGYNGDWSFIEWEERVDVKRPQSDGTFETIITNCPCVIGNQRLGMQTTSLGMEPAEVRKFHFPQRIVVAREVQELSTMLQANDVIVAPDDSEWTVRQVDMPRGQEEHFTCVCVRGVTE